MAVKNKGTQKPMHLGCVDGVCAISVPADDDASMVVVQTELAGQILDERTDIAPNGVPVPPGHIALVMERDVSGHVMSRLAKAHRAGNTP